MNKPSKKPKPSDSEIVRTGLDVSVKFLKRFNRQLEEVKRTDRFYRRSDHFRNLLDLGAEAWDSKQNNR